MEDEVKVKVEEELLTPQDKFHLMAKKNDKLGKLIKEFKLKLI